MLFEFRVENFRSIRAEQALSLIAANRIDPGSTVPRKSKSTDSVVLPAIAIYGSNASGKSNVLAAMTFMRDAVILSHRYWNPEGGIPRTPFAWGGGALLPSLFEVTFETSTGHEFNYGFSLTDDSIEEEWLHGNPSKKKQVWFERKKSDYKFGGGFTGPMETVESMTRSNALFLSTAVQVGSESLKPVYSFFSQMLPFGKLGLFPTQLAAMDSISPALFPSLQSELPLFGVEDDLVEKVRGLFRQADFGIVDIKKLEYDRQAPNGKTVKGFRYVLQHEEGNDDSWIPLQEESDGTQTLFRMAPRIFRALETGGVLLVDELESSLHPHLASKIVDLFNCPMTNQGNAQLVFSTHDTNLLGNTAGEPSLRRDQVWLTEKDKSGATTLYPLTNYKPRNVENLERGYLQGRYGAIPFLGGLNQVPSPSPES